MWLGENIDLIRRNENNKITLGSDLLPFNPHLSCPPNNAVCFFRAKSSPADGGEDWPTRKGGFTARATGDGAAARPRRPGATCHQLGAGSPTPVNAVEAGTHVSVRGCQCQFPCQWTKQ